MDINTRDNAAVLAAATMDYLAKIGTGDTLQYRLDDIGWHEATGHVVLSGDSYGALQFHGGGVSVAISSFEDGSVVIALIDSDTNRTIEDIRRYSLADALDTFDDAWGVARFVRSFREHNARRFDELAEAESAEQIA